MKKLVLSMALSLTFISSTSSAGLAPSHENLAAVIRSHSTSVEMKRIINDAIESKGEELSKDEVNFLRQLELYYTIGMASSVTDGRINQLRIVDLKSRVDVIYALILTSVKSSSKVEESFYQIDKGLGSLDNRINEIEAGSKKTCFVLNKLVSEVIKIENELSSTFSLNKKKINSLNIRRTAFANKIEELGGVYLLGELFEDDVCRKVNYEAEKKILEEEVREREMFSVRLGKLTNLLVASSRNVNARSNDSSTYWANVHNFNKSAFSNNILTRPLPTRNTKSTSR